MQFSPALPWAEGTRGTITLREPVSKDDLLNGALTFINGNGDIYQPEEGDGYVNYLDNEQQEAFSIAITDEEELTVISVTTASGFDIAEIIMSTPSGLLLNITAMKSDGTIARAGESGFLVGQTEGYNGVETVAISQDGINVITVDIVTGPTDYPMRILNRQQPVVLNSLFKFPAAPPEGVIANMPIIKGRLISFNNDASLQCLYAPNEMSNDFGVGAILRNNNGQTVEWGSSQSELYCG